MGFFTGAGRAIDVAQLAGAAARAPGDFDRLKGFGVSRVPDGQAFGNQIKTAFKNSGDDIVLRDEKGYAQQAIEKEYGLNTEKAKYVVDLARAKGGGAYTNDLQRRIDNELAPARKAKAAPASRMAGTALQDLGIDISPDSKRKRSSDLERVRLGDKDKRSLLAEEKLRIADDLAGGGFSRDQLVDMLNQPGVQQGENYINALNNDPRIQAVANLDSENYFMRPEMEAPDFVGEGQFGRVSELAPGYVSKKQAPLVEWGGYSDDNSGKGNLIGQIHDYRNVQDEVNQLNYLNNRGKGITPKVENLIIEDDGATEVIMRDLRENYGGGDSFLKQQAAIFNDDNASQKQKAQAFKNHELFRVKSKQQEAQAALLGVELQDRHLGNVMAHKMNNRPLQIDPSGRSVSGFEKDAVVIKSVTDGFAAAGLDQEADIFYGLAQEAVERRDATAVHDLAQQGMSRLMKIKGVI